MACANGSSLSPKGPGVDGSSNIDANSSSFALSMSALSRLASGTGVPCVERIGVGTSESEEELYTSASLSR
jgi:hypothetical protein